MDMIIILSSTNLLGLIYILRQRKWGFNVSLCASSIGWLGRRTPIDRSSCIEHHF